MKQKLTTEMKNTFAGHIVDGKSVLEAGKLAGIENPYDALPQCQKQIKLFEENAIAVSQHKYQMMKEEALFELASICRNEKNAVIKLRALKEILGAIKKDEQKLRDLLTGDIDPQEVPIVELPAIEE